MVKSASRHHVGQGTSAAQPAALNGSEHHHRIKTLPQRVSTMADGKKSRQTLGAPVRAPNRLNRRDMRRVL